MNKRKLFIISIMIVFLVSVHTVSIAVIKGKVNTETVRIRKEATTESSIVKLVSIGEKVTVTGESGDWYKVKIDDVTGYIRKDLLDLDGEYPSNNENEGQAEEPEQSTEEVNSNESEPENENNGEGENPKEDTQVENSGDNNQDENNSSTENENTESSEQNQEIPMGESKTISTIMLNQQEKQIGAKKNLQKDVSLKILPLANSNNIIEVKANTEVTIVEIINSWCKVETVEGESGWIRIDQ